MRWRYAGSEAELAERVAAFYRCVLVLSRWLRLLALLLMLLVLLVLLVLCSLLMLVLVLTMPPIALRTGSPRASPRASTSTR